MENEFLEKALIRIEEIKYPEMTKKISTPINPPGSTFGKA